MSFHRTFLHSGLALVLALAFAGAARADALTDRATALLNQGNARAAYELLAPEEANRAGDVAYDFLLGLAALESGRNTSAVFAFERVLAVEPNHVRARAEIARAYLALGETGTARQEFKTVKEQGVPPEVAATIDRLLSAIERAEDTGRTTLRGYLEASLGHDSNVNSATADREHTVPAFGGIILDTANVKKSDSYTSVAAGLNLRHPLGKDIALVAGLNGIKRMNSSHDRFDTGTVDASVGAVRSVGKNTLSAALQYNRFWLDNDRYRSAMGAIVQLQHNYDARNQASLYFQYADLDHDKTASRAFDAQRAVLGANFAHALAGFKTVFYGGAYVGAQDTRVERNGHDLQGLRGGVQHEFRSDLRAWANLGYEHRRYHEDYTGFTKKRDDDQWNLGLGLAWTPAKDWRVTPQYQYTDNRSNISLHRHKREVVSVTVRRDF